MFGKKDSPKAEVVKKQFEEAPPSVVTQANEELKEEKTVPTPQIYAKVPLLVIREPRESDEGQIYELGQSIPEVKCEEGEEWLSKNDVHSYAAYHQGKCLVAVLDGKIIGFLITDDENFQHGCITFLGVHPDYRKEGIGTYLLSQIETTKTNYKDWYLFATSESSVSYFESQGYKKGKTMTYMRKILKKE